MDDLLDSDGPCCEWEAVAKRQAKEINQLKADIAMYEQRLASDVQFVSELRKPKVPSETQKAHCEAQTDEQGRLLYAPTKSVVKIDTPTEEHPSLSKRRRF